MPVLAVGLNRRTVEFDMLERFTVSDTKLPKALRDLIDGGHVSEAVLLSTCMRTEVYADIRGKLAASRDARFRCRLSAPELCNRICCHRNGAFRPG